MKGKHLFLAILLAAGSYAVGRWHSRPATANAATANAATAARKILYYHCPMHPSYKSDKPGLAPDCGMDLEPVYAEPAAFIHANEDTPAPGLVKVSAEKQQMIGVRIGEVEKSSGTHVLRTVGRISADEARVFRLTAKVDGWIRDIFPSATGSLVKKGQPLVSVYSRDFQTAQQAYVFALNALDRFRKGDEPDALDRLKLALADARANLEALGMSADQIEAIGRTRKILLEVKLVAPANGVIVARNVFAEQKFDKGMDLYRIVDLSRVWVLADVFEREAEYIQPGAVAQVTLPHAPGKVLTAHASKVLPQFDGSSRTLKVRLDADNPQFVLKPDMYVDVEFSVSTPAAVAVPAGAVVDSGLSKTVFVDRGRGYFEPRPVETGWRFGDRVEIRKGLEAGERIVVSGNFLIDSETRMKAAREPAPDPAAARACPKHRAEQAAQMAGNAMRGNAVRP